MMGKLKLLGFIIFCAALVPMYLYGGGAGEKSGATIPSEEKTVPGAAEKPISVFVSILPQKYLAEQIGGDLTDVQVLVKPGQSPHSYEPTPSQMTALGKADIIFTVGVEFEKALLPKIRSNLPNLAIVESNHGIEYRKMAGHSHDEHAEDAEEHENHSAGRDPHVWLNPENGKIIARNMRDAFIEINPGNRENFETNYRILAEKVDQADAELAETLKPLRGETLFVFHPSFGYFADRYGLEQIAIEIEGREPGPRQLEEIIEHAKEQGVRVIFVQPQFSKKSAETVARAIDGAVVPIDPLAYDWLDNLKRIGEKVRQGLSK